MLPMLRRVLEVETIVDLTPRCFRCEVLIRDVVGAPHLPISVQPLILQDVAQKVLKRRVETFFVANFKFLVTEKIKKIISVAFTKATCLHSGEGSAP